jgi:peroxiredoxin/predicted 2-oxoglutarate/Fe(II)-dependent dioxygenase YbiX
MTLSPLTFQPMPGDPVPGFVARSPQNPRYSFDSAAGRWLVLCFYGSAADPLAQGALKAVASRPDLFSDSFACFFGVSNDPADESQGRVANRIPGYRFLWDFDVAVARRFRLAPKDAIPGEGLALVRCWLVIDPTMRVQAVVPFRPDGSDAAEVLGILDRLPRPDLYAGFPVQAPILVLPRVFEPELCAHLIGLYEADGGQDSGFMRQVDGRTVGVSDKSFKSRRDYDIADRDLIAALQARFMRRVVPEIAKVHQFKVTRMERYIVSCYAVEDGGHFSAHRDNTTSGTAHRRFAVSVNLNDDFDGGEVSFPEYGPRSFKAPPGGAVVFSCSLLHAVSRVTRGRRYAFLPFLYDEAAARIREANAGLVGDTGSGYRATAPQPQEGAAG